ncbi:MAG TPA: polysaccharide deacetylase family protein [Opitutaceae bacterium]
MTRRRTSRLTRREFIATSLLGAAALGLGARPAQRPLMLIRYDTESRQPEEMKGFFEKMIPVHRVEGIPATFFCLGAAMEMREQEFRSFFGEIEGDPLFDIQDHSYSHVGVGYDAGRSVEEIRTDFIRSFDVHERLRGKRPTGVSLAGTGTRDGQRLAGFDATEKARAELVTLAGVGVRMINTFHSRVADHSKEFMSYRNMGFPDVMGFPSGHSDNRWLRGRQFGEPREYILSEIRERGVRAEHIPLMFHDDTVWIDVNDKDLAIVRLVADAGRKAGFELVTHIEAYRRTSLWSEKS